MEEIRKNLQEIKSDIKEISSDIKAIDHTLVKQQASLDEHIRRTNILEQKLEPIEKHVQMISGVLKFIGILSVIAGFIVSLMKILS